MNLPSLHSLLLTAILQSQTLFARQLLDKFCRSLRTEHFIIEHGKNFMKHSKCASILLFLTACSSQTNTDPNKGDNNPTTSARSMPFSIITVPSFSPGTIFGQGVNTYLGITDIENLGVCVQIPRIIPPPQFNGTTVELKIHQIKTGQEFVFQKNHR